MNRPTGLQRLLAALAPRLDSRVYRFVEVTPDKAPQLLAGAIGTFREDEGVSAIVPVEIADEAACPGADFGRIILGVASGLEDVGLTAAISTALTQAGIACNVVAALHHDHLFVPRERAEEAIKCLQELSATPATPMH